MFSLLKREKEGNGDAAGWFSTIQHFEDLDLDIVGILAILGEGSVLSNAQVSTLSNWIFLPRLLPAPHAMLRVSRPNRLEAVQGRVTGVVSGNDRNELNHIGDIVLDTESLKPFDVRCVEIDRHDEAPVVKTHNFSYLTFNICLGCAFAIALLILSIIWEDGMGLIADCTLSLLATVIGIGNKWTLKLPRRRNPGGTAPRGDVVIRHPRGSFLIVKCEENIAREIFFAPETVEYLVSDLRLYRIISLVGSLLLMVGVICLANAKTKTQVSVAAAYLILNVTYWLVAALPSRMHWNTSAFRVRRHMIKTNGKPAEESCKNSTFTQALWTAIAVTKRTGWVQLGEAAPKTRVWDEWLREAREMVENVELEGTPDKTIYNIPKWDPQERLNALLADPSLSEVESIYEKA
ncbi:hypothetical protein IWZ03DRAFT_405153 [Phyllosticta citriasiana]|uniref:Uncharacterized protein n=1 Tax=Phyllosticta citriasiana TaxID=595635 RepID=A0ABR1KTT6_9PEZI